MKWLIHASTSASPASPRVSSMHFVTTVEDEMTQGMIREIQRGLEIKGECACCFAILGFQPLAG